MSDEELEQDDLDVNDEEDGEELAAADDDEADTGADDEGTDSERAIPTSKKAKAKTVVVEELPSLEAKQRERDELARAMEEFLARGGRVQEVEPNVVADPPKKPDSKYGSRPI
jgi:translation initiation factor 1 (eIF-1/SUI1)